jgi:glycosyltransferase involved in cell wall biosynthesis
MTEKKTILTISDHPLSPSGVGTQTKYVIEALLATDRYKFVSLGGAVQHRDYQPQRVEPYLDDWKIYPVDGYGNKDIIRSIIRNEKPDVLWFMTDPRFYGWLWEMEDEIRPLVPMMYYHVWDNYPLPTFNAKFYNSNDCVATISKVTNAIVSELANDLLDVVHLPHSVDTDVFKRLTEEEVLKFREQSFGKDNKKMLFFWNNRNARRKQSGSLIFWFKDFLDRVGHDKASLIMHTDPLDMHGQNLEAIIMHLGLDEGQVLLSKDKIPAAGLALMYNMVDCTVNISDAEGFGLATLESLACETPIIVNMTGGLQEQVTDGENWFGAGLEPSSKAIIGSQDIPWIYEDRICGDEFVAKLEEFYNLSIEERQALGEAGRAHVMKNYSFETFKQDWVQTIDDFTERHGSWGNRKGYESWRVEEL